MKIYSVGGSVRDEILKEKSSDRDFVVVGATVEEFLKKFPNAKKIGSSFPVFLVDGAEYAFARIEKKSGPGYHGFEIESHPEVTLIEDLKRRDLTINAMAKDIETGEIIDPFGGIKDLDNKRIVHVTEAFAEDPLRVYRVARFASRFYDFSIDKTTIKLMNSLKNELNTLSVERVWTECLKALSSKKPARFFSVLDEAGVLDVHFPELLNLKNVPAGPVEYHPEDIDTFHHTVSALERVSDIQSGTDPLLSFSVICHDFGKALTNPDDYPHHHGHDKSGVELIKTFSKRLKVPKKFEEAAVIFTKNHMKISRIFEMTPSKALKLIQEMGKFPYSIEGFLKCVEADSGKPSDHLMTFIQQVLPALEVKLPEKWHNQGEKSAAMLNQLRIEKYKELKKQFLLT
ncbi:MAG TPA: HD domain-containing protein [bacterium]|nr:HD domain-containing protein [bacterium]HPY14545.1 HD domain-containing protein [bacterium]HQB08306.1 HD domain-containing protein [bacterium]HQN72710.1 HD domain-containing protein [bacterium]HQO90905.1 HD domain-containing protein [bacterium]